MIFDSLPVRAMTFSANSRMVNSPGLPRFTGPILCVEQVVDVALPSGEVVVKAEDLVAVREKAFAEVAAQESGPARDENAQGRIAHDDGEMMNHKLCGTPDASSAIGAEPARPDQFLAFLAGWPSRRPGEFQILPVPMPHQHYHH